MPRSASAFFNAVSSNCRKSASVQQGPHCPSLTYLKYGERALTGAPGGLHGARGAGGGAYSLTLASHVVILRCYCGLNGGQRNAAAAAAWLTKSGSAKRPARCAL